MKLTKILENGWEQPSSEEQKEAIFDYIDIYLDNSQDKVEFLNNLRDYLIDYEKTN